MEKPESVTLKDWLVRKLAKSNDLDKDLVDRIVKHQFESVVSAMQKNKSVEISGFGVFRWKDVAAQKKLDSFDRQIRSFRAKILESNNENQIQKWNDIIDDILLKRQVLINRINEINSDLRRVEKPSTSRKKTKEADK
jgi:hypothetical protein